MDASQFGASPSSSAELNTRALQNALDHGGRVEISQPGIYDVCATLYIGSDSSLICGEGVYLRKVASPKPFCQLLLNRGAKTKTWDEHITVEGLRIIVNGVESFNFEVFGLRGHLGFHYVRDLNIRGFRCYDLGAGQYAVQVCTFEDIRITDTIIKGGKDGIHLGRGRRFTIDGGVFETGDDAVALNGHDYATGNPELGDIRDGIVSNCHDLAGEKEVGHFCRILAGGWTDWFEGMELQNSDTVVSRGRLYRVDGAPDGVIYKSVTRPEFDEKMMELDGIQWRHVQDDGVYTALVKNVTFRDIFLSKKRGAAFSVHFDCDKFSRSYYPNAPIPLQQSLIFDGVRVETEAVMPFISVLTPVDELTMSNCFFKNNDIHFASNRAMTDYGLTRVRMNGCVFSGTKRESFIVNDVEGKRIEVE